MLEIRQLSKKLGARMVLDSLNLKVESGEVIFILGRSGVGKSVLLKTIVGLIPPDSGEIILDGVITDPENEDLMSRIRRECGLVFQTPTLLDALSVRANLEFCLDKLDESALLEMVSWMNLSPNILDQFPFQLSYGVQKKVSLLRTLLLKPKYLLFDEPTTGLDPVSAEITNQLIKRGVIHLEAGVIVVSHDVRAALNLATKICLLQDGKFVFEGAPEEFRNSKVPLIRAFLENTVFL